MTIRYDGQVAIVTGAGNGLGKSHALQLAARGAKVVVNDLGGTVDGSGGGSDASQAVVAEIEAAGGEAMAHGANVADFDQVQDMVSKTMERWGRVDILINNAAIGDIIKPLTELNLREWQQVITVNLTGAFLFTREAARVMDNGASIVNIASQAAKTGFRQMAPYVSSKHGMIGLTRTAAIDLASKGIRVNAVCPNHVTTTMGKAQSEYFSSLRGLAPEAYRAQIAERVPLGRVGRPEDTAAAVAFLASDEAAFITGEALNVSGGEETH